MRLSVFFTQQVWPRRGWAACLLWPLTLLSGCWIQINRLLYQSGWRQSVRLPVPVLVVGNVVAGGTGKTPVVISLVQHFTAKGFHVGVIARAYGSSHESVQEVNHHSQAAEAGDEPLLVKQRCDVPVFVGRKRALAAQALLSAYPNTNLIISDDGMQHHALRHDIAICVFDERGSGNGWLLPAGPLREPWPTATPTGVNRHVLYTGKQHPQDAWVAKRSLAAYARNGAGEQRDLREWADQAVQALAAIAKPDVFFQALAQAGLRLVQRWPLPDHDSLSHWKPDSHLPIFCTEKDAVKLWPHLPEAWAVPLVCELPLPLLDALALNLQQLSLIHGQKTA
jgi:tetraacyldisaccharide 4'-kinase